MVKTIKVKEKIASAGKLAARASGGLAGTMAAAGAMAPLAYAGPIDELFSSTKDSVLMPFYIGLLACVGTVALIVLIVEIVRGATSPAGRQNDHIAKCLVIIGICIVLGFAPALLNYMLQLGGGAGNAVVSTS